MMHLTLEEFCPHEADPCSYAGDGTPKVGGILVITDCFTVKLMQYQYHDRAKGGDDAAVEQDGLMSRMVAAGFD